MVNKEDAYGVRLQSIATAATLKKQNEGDSLEVQVEEDEDLFADEHFHLPGGETLIEDGKEEYFDEKEGKQPSLKQIEVYTDSTYLKEGITVWINAWEKNNWKTTDKKNVKNVDLWKRLQELTKSNQIEWKWIKGHSKDPLNDLADELAKKATPI